MGRKRQTELTLPQNHSPGQILNRLLNHIVQHPHHRDGLLLAESFLLQPLNELECVEVMIALSNGGGMERAPCWLEGRDIDAIMSDRITEWLGGF